jgi:hypothetical protein
MNKQKTWLRYLGFLGLLGLLSLITDNTGFAGFFGFFGFFGFSTITPDERFQSNVNKAAKNAFIPSILGFAITTTYVTLSRNVLGFAAGFALTFAVQILTFSFSLQYYESSGKN